MIDYSGKILNHKLHQMLCECVWTQLLTCHTKFPSMNVREWLNSVICIVLRGQVDLKDTIECRCKSLLINALSWDLLATNLLPPLSTLPLRIEVHCFSQNVLLLNASHVQITPDSTLLFSGSSATDLVLEMCETQKEGERLLALYFI